MTTVSQHMTTVSQHRIAELIFTGVRTSDLNKYVGLESATKAGFMY
jgi:hypothetical protein